LPQALALEAITFENRLHFLNFALTEVIHLSKLAPTSD
jgi:hypothetical protein